jgi:hypothetical protein
MYLVATKDSGGGYHQRLHALDLTTGSGQSNSPSEIRATYPNANGQLSFNPAQYKARAALLLLNGVIYSLNSRSDTCSKLRSPFRGP